MNKHISIEEKGIKLSKINYMQSFMPLILKYGDYGTTDVCLPGVKN